MRPLAVDGHPRHHATGSEPRNAGLWASAAPALAFSGDAVWAATNQALALPAVVGLLVVGGITAACSVRVNMAAALWIAVLGWLFVVGFVLNSYGVLQVRGASGWWPLAALTLVALVSSRATAPPSRTSGRAASGPSPRAEQERQFIP